MKSSKPPVVAPVPLFGSSRLLHWLDAGGRFEQRTRLLPLRLRWSACWFDRHLDITAARWAATPLPDRIVFIVGMWRSGTTALHTALHRATGWSTPETWQCFRPADFSLLPAPRENFEKRPMDEARVGTHSPQEDEFAALLLGEPSVYRGFLDPRRLGELAPLLGEWRALSADHVPLSNRWELFLKAVCANRPAPLLLKSPNHSFRVPWLARRFPAARFLWITRGKDAMLESNRRMWTAMFERYALWPAPANALDRFLDEATTQHDAVLAWACENLGPRLIVVPFERATGDDALVGELLRRINDEAL